MTLVQHTFTVTRWTLTVLAFIFAFVAVYKHYTHLVGIGGAYALTDALIWTVLTLFMFAAVWGVEIAEDKV